MKKAIISIALISFSLSSNFALGAVSQANNSRNSPVPLQTVLEKLSKSTKTHFFYSVPAVGKLMVDEDKINYKNLSQSLAYLSGKLPIEYQIDNDKVSIRRKPTAVSNVPDSFVASEKSANTIAPKKIPDTIAPKEKAIEEVVITALGISKEKKKLAYSTQNLNEEQFTRVKQDNIAKSLSGKVAGLQITEGSSGVGSNARILIRGNRSIAGNNQPLIVVDGVPISNSSASLGEDGSNVPFNRVNGENAMPEGISSINPDDIESVNVLKGANAAALYGSRAANGVLVITTKSGKGKKGLGVTYSSTTTWSQPIILTKFQNVYGQGTGGKYDKAAISSWGPAMNGQSVESWYLSPRIGGQATYDYSPQPNNVRDFFNTGSYFANALGVNLVGDKVNAYFSYKNENSEGIIDKNKLTRNLVNLKTNFKVNEKIALEVKVSGLISDIAHKPFTGESTFNVWRQISRIPRNIPLSQAQDYQYINSDGLTRQNFWTLNGGGGGNLSQNPYWVVNNVNLSENQNRLYGYAKMDFKLLPNLNLMMRSGIDKTIVKTETKLNNDTYIRATNGNYISSNYDKMEQNYDFLLTYNNRFNKLKYTVNAGGNLLKQDNMLISMNNTSLLRENFFNHTNASFLYQSNQAPYSREVQSLYAMADVEISDFLFLNATGRNDWSSTMPSSARSYFYPSVGGSLLLSNLFKEKPKFVDLIKLRGNWAMVGNDAKPYLINSTYTFAPGGNNGYVTLDNVKPIANLKPEKTTSTEFGLETAFFRQRINLDVSYYKSRSQNQLLLVSLPAASLYSSQYINAGIVENRGVDVTLNVVPVKAKDFRWDMNFTFNNNKSNVVKITDDVKKYTIASDYLVDNVLMEGHPFGELYVRGYARDTNGNVIIQSNGLPRLTTSKSVYAGNFNPKWTGGIGTNLSYKNVSLNFLVDFKQGGTIVSFTNSILTATGVTEETLPGREGFIVSGVKADGTPNDITITAEQYWTTVGGRNNPVGEAFVTDASTIRMREISFEYRFPSKWLQNTVIQKMSFSLTGRNLFFFQNKAKTFDPELAPSTGNAQGIESFGIPNTRSVGCNFNITF